MIIFNVFGWDHLAQVDCGNSSLGVFDHEASYKAAKSLVYPVNVARNVAKESANTHFVFPSDIELYPSPGLLENVSFIKKCRWNSCSK